LLLSASCLAQQPVDAASEPIPDVRVLMTEVADHQHKLEKVRENYTYRSANTTEEIDSSGKVTKTETEDTEVFFVNSHQIERTVKKNGKPLDDHDQKKETERVTKLVEKAEKTPPGQGLEHDQGEISISHLLDIMEVGNPRRVSFRGRQTIVFDFAGRKDAKTHGIAEDASKKIAGTVWIDERDRQVARMEARFTDNFHVAGAGERRNLVSHRSRGAHRGSRASGQGCAAAYRGARFGLRALSCGCRDAKECERGGPAEELELQLCRPSDIEKAVCRNDRRNLASIVHSDGLCRG
jgi:hypothetical protein